MRYQDTEDIQTGRRAGLTDTGLHTPSHNAVEMTGHCHTATAIQPTGREEIQQKLTLNHAFVMLNKYICAHMKTGILLHRFMCSKAIPAPPHLS